MVLAVRVRERPAGRKLNFGRNGSLGLCLLKSASLWKRGILILSHFNSEILNAKAQGQEYGEGTKRGNSRKKILLF